MTGLDPTVLRKSRCYLNSRGKAQLLYLIFQGNCSDPNHPKQWKILARINFMILSSNCFRNNHKISNSVHNNKHFKISWSDVYAWDKAMERGRVYVDIKQRMDFIDWGSDIFLAVRSEVMNYMILKSFLEENNASFI